MNHVYAKIKHRGKSNKYRKVLSTNENIYHPADELIESSCPYTPGTMLETGAWFKISEFSKQKYSIEITHDDYETVDYDSLHITYDTIEGSYDSSIFTAEKHALTMDKAYKAQKAIQDYVFTDGTAEKSVERKFAENLDGAEEVFIYAKLPKGFYIPTPVGHYSPDWAIVFHEGKVKHIYFVAETKGTMESLNLRPIEKSKIDCAKKLFAKLSDGLVTYDHVDSYQELMNKVLQ